MARALAVARATVATENQDAYRRVLEDAGRLLREHGVRFWAFRHAQRAGSYLEFREADSEAALRAAALPAGVASQLRALASYEPGADDIWLEL